jgi:hypothetical protein
MGDAPLGTAQSWSNVTSSRSLGTTYTNSTGRAIAVMFLHNPYSGGTHMVINGSDTYNGGSQTNVVGYFTWYVPTGATYAFNANYGAVTWWEFR